MKSALHWTAAFALTLAWVATLWQRGELGLVWDEPPLVERHIAMARWWAELAGTKPKAHGSFTLRGLDAGWPFCREAPHEHPPLQALASLATYWLCEPFLGPIRSIRLATVLGYAALAATVFSLAKRRWGGMPATAAIGFLWFQPRFLGDMQLATFDGLGAATFFFAGLAMLRACSAGPTWCFGIVAGLAVMTKATGILIVPAMAIWALSCRVKQAVKPLLWCALLGPITAIVVFPGWWTRPIGGPLRWSHALLNYDQRVATQYLGTTYDQNTRMTPWHKPFATLFATTPLPWLLFLLGCVLPRRGNKAATDEPISERALIGWAWIGALAAPIAQAAHVLPGHDGTRQLASAFPFFAVVIAHAVARIDDWLQAVVGRLGAALVIIGAIGWAASDVWRVHPYELSYYGVQVGGAAGAQRLGFETTYYWDAVNSEVLGWLNFNLQDSARLILFPPTDVRCFAWYQRWGMLRDDIEILQFDRPDIMPVLGKMLEPHPAYFLFLHREGKYIMSKGENPMTFASMATARAKYELTPPAVGVRLLAIFDSEDFGAAWPELKKSVLKRPPAGD